VLLVVLALQGVMGFSIILFMILCLLEIIMGFDSVKTVSLHGGKFMGVYLLILVVTPTILALA